MNKDCCPFNKKYQLHFTGVQYDIINLDKDTIELTCTSADLEHHPHCIGLHKVFKVKRFQIAENIFCVSWNIEIFAIIQIEDFNKMVVNKIYISPALEEIREVGTILIP